MPYEWIPPELFLEYAGVAVYHCYDDGSMVSTYWFTTDPSDCNYKFPDVGNKAQFDVRELPNLGLKADDPNSHGVIIRQAIESGLITGEPATHDRPPVVKIEVRGGVAYVVEQPPGVEVEIVDYDGDNKGENS